MGSFSIWHWLIVLIWVGLAVYPVAKILSKAGFSRWWVIVMFIPIINFIGLWVFALSSWPNGGSDR